MIERPRITVAAVVERDGRFLMVEEERQGRRVFNQPAGHVEGGESLLEATIRETREETGRDFLPEALLGVYRWSNPETGATFVRIAVSGEVSEQDPARPLDDGIVGTVWLGRDELAAQPERLRSPMVLRCLDDHAAGRRYPLELLVDLPQ